LSIAEKADKLPMLRNLLLPGIALILTSTVWAQEAPSATTAETETSAPAAVAVDPVEQDDVVITIGEYDISRQEFEAMLSSLPRSMRQRGNLERYKRQFALQLATVVMAGKIARERELDKKPENAAKIAYQENLLLMNFLRDALVEEASITDEMRQEYYEKNKGIFEVARARHILVRYKGVRTNSGAKPTRDVEEAEELIFDLKKRIDAGEDFAAVAQEFSEDTVSAKKGGDLGEFGRRQMTGTFADAAFSQEVGKVGEVVRTPFGYHLILVEQRGPRPLEEVKEDIDKALLPGITNKAFQELIKEAEVIYNDDYFGAPEKKEDTPGSGNSSSN
jgi:parvulin-like peptidyl-prolyl isomerase